MPERLVHSPVAWAGVFLALFYVVLALLIPIAILIQVLNGIFVGMTVALVVAFWRLGWEVMRLTSVQYHREDQWSISSELIWIGILINRSYSIILQILDAAPSTSNSHWIGVSLYVWIIGGSLQITAPGLSQGLLRGLHNWTLYIAMFIGAVVAIGLTLAQSWGSGAL